MSENQRTAILRYLKTHGTITQVDALMKIGCFRLSARIKELRNEGADIRTEFVKDERGKHYARYIYSDRGPGQQQLFST